MRGISPDHRPGGRRIAVASALLILLIAQPTPAEEPSAPPAVTVESGPPRLRDFAELVGESLGGDAYAEPGTWRPLPLRTFFTEGWDEPWVSPPSGSGGAPRQGWINGLDGVFYRLAFLNFTYSNDFHHDGSRYLGSYTLFAPISRRFELRFDVPFLVSNKGGASNTYHGNVGDFAITPRFLLSETRDVTQVLALGIRTPTGKSVNASGLTGLSPQYEFWTNPVDRVVVRGGVGATIPTTSRGRTIVNANLAVGKYLTPHDLLPIGDLVVYLAATMTTTVDDRGPNSTYVSLTPGFRSHLGSNWYVLGGVEVPLTGPKPFDYQPITWLMKVF